MGDVKHLHRLTLADGLGQRLQFVVVGFNIFKTCGLVDGLGQRFQLVVRHVEYCQLLELAQGRGYLCCGGNKDSLLLAVASLIIHLNFN